MRQDFPLPGWSTETEGETQRLYSRTEGDEPEDELRVTISPTDDGQLCVTLPHGDAGAMGAVAALFIGAILAGKGAD